MAPATLKQSGINALSLAFFAPLPLASASQCDWLDLKTPCLKPATDAGALSLGFFIDVVKNFTAQLGKNTAPVRDQRPTVFFSFGGKNEGAYGWNQIFASATLAAQV